MLLTDKSKEHTPKRTILFKLKLKSYEGWRSKKKNKNECNGKLTKMLEKYQRRKINQLQKNPFPADFSSLVSSQK